MKKLFLSCLLSALYISTVFSEDYSGTCGANLTWSFEPSTGVLSISGIGEMEDYEYISDPKIYAPWINLYEKVTKIKIDQGVTSIGNFAFYNFSKTNSVDIANSVTRIGKYAFTYSGINSVILSNNLTSIEYMSFCYCCNITEIIIPNSVTSIGSSCFRNCNELTNVQIGNGVTTLGNYTFAICKKLKSITIGNNVQSLGELAFQECSIENIDIPNSVKTIKSTAFQDCNELKKVHIGTGIKDIEKDAFYGCYNFTQLIIDATTPPSVNYSFWQTGLQTVYVPCNSVSSYLSASGWSGYKIVGMNCPDQPTIYNVSVSSENSSMGTVSGGGQYEEGATATITATAKSGYKFTKWSNGSHENPYSFTVTQDVSLTAYFEQSSTPQSNSKFWNMSDADFKSLGTLTSDKTVNGLTIYATSSKNVVIDESSQKIDGLSFTHRLKLNGTGASNSRLLSFKVDGDCDIDVYLISASSSADRTLNVDKGGFGQSLTNIPAHGASISKETVHYTGSTTTIYMYSPNSGVNIYAIRVSYADSQGIEMPTTGNHVHKILYNGQILIIGDDKTYTITGAEIK